MVLSSTKIFALESRLFGGWKWSFIFTFHPHPTQSISKIMKEANIVFVGAMCKAWFQEPHICCWHLDVLVI